MNDEPWFVAQNPAHTNFFIEEEDRIAELITELLYGRIVKIKIIGLVMVCREKILICRVTVIKKI